MLMDNNDQIVAGDPRVSRPVSAEKGVAWPPDKLTTIEPNTRYQPARRCFANAVSEQQGSFLFSDVVEDGNSLTEAET